MSDEQKYDLIIRAVSIFAIVFIYFWMSRRMEKRWAKQDAEREKQFSKILVPIREE